jgi:DNA-binding transcriptional regulator YbjK
MSIVARVHALTPQRSAPLRPDEEALKTQIDALASDFTGKRPAEAAYLLEDPNSGVSSGRLQTKVNELWVAMAQKRSKQMLSASKEEWTITDEQEMQKVLEVLAQQQRTLDYLSQTLTFDIQALDIVKTGFNEASFLETERKMQQSGTPTRK